MFLKFPTTPRKNEKAAESARWSASEFQFASTTKNSSQAGRWTRCGRVAAKGDAGDPSLPGGDTECP